MNEPLKDPENKADMVRRVFNVAYPSPQKGDFWPYEELEQINGLGHDREEIRRSMNDIIKPMLMHRGLVVECVRNQGYRINRDSQNVELDDKLNGQGIKKIKRGLVVLGNTDREKLDELGKARYDLGQRRGASLIALNMSLPKPKAPKAIQDGNGGDRKGRERNGKDNGKDWIGSEWTGTDWTNEKTCHVIPKLLCFEYRCKRSETSPQWRYCGQSTEITRLFV